MRLRHHPPTRPGVALQRAAQIVDDRTGIIRHVYEVPIEPDAPRIFGFGSVLANTAVYGVNHAESVNGSTSIDRSRALAGAIGEAIERYSAGVNNAGDVLLATYAELRDSAIDPRLLTLYSTEQYERAGFPYEPFVPEATLLGWTRGYSLTRGMSVLVPLCCVYMPYDRPTAEPRLVQQITTGLACGSTLEEAILSGLYEVIERDAAMTLWLQRAVRPGLTVGSQTSPIVRETLDRFRHTDLGIHMVDATTNVGIPVVVAVARGVSGGNPAAIFASCADRDLEGAAIGALNELAQCVGWIRNMMTNKPDSHIELTSVRSIEDHVMWPTDPDHWQNAAFVLQSTDQTSLTPDMDHDTDDVLTDINECVARLSALNLEAIVVDVTAPDILEAGFHVVRVLVPGAQPLYFGQGLERIAPRALTDVYCESADITHVTTNPDALNLTPHPFP